MPYANIAAAHIAISNANSTRHISHISSYSSLSDFLLVFIYVCLFALFSILLLVVFDGIIQPFMLSPISKRIEKAANRLSNDMNQIMGYKKYETAGIRFYESALLGFSGKAIPYETRH